MLNCLVGTLLPQRFEHLHNVVERFSIYVQVPSQVLNCCGKQGEAVPTHQDWSVSTRTHSSNQLWGNWRLYKSYNHCPCKRPTYMTKSWPLARLQVLQNHGSRMFISLGGEGWKALSLGHCFSSIFENSRKNNGQAFPSLLQLLLFCKLWSSDEVLLPANTIAIITPIRQARTCGQVWAPDPTPTAPKEWKLDNWLRCSCQELNPYQCEIITGTDEIKEKQIQIIEPSNTTI